MVGESVGEPGAWSVMLLPNHGGDPAHFEIGFVPSATAAEHPVILDDLTGFGVADRTVAHVLHLWRQTSGACFLEMITRRGRFAAHLDGGGSIGVPGWHTIASGVIGYGPDDEANAALQGAMLRGKALHRLGDLLRPLLDRPANNGIKLLYRQAGPTVTADVSVNGVADEAASRALAELDWPVVDADTSVRCFAVATGPER